MRTLFSWVVFLGVFAVCALPFVLYQVAERRGDADTLTPLGAGVFAAVTGLAGMALAGWAAQRVREMRPPEAASIQLPRVATTKIGATQVLFAGITIAFVAIALQHYPIYRGVLDFDVEYDMDRFFEAGWLVYVGGLMALYGGYRLAIGAKGEGAGDD